MKKAKKHSLFLAAILFRYICTAWNWIGPTVTMDMLFSIISIKRLFRSPEHSEKMHGLKSTGSIGPTNTSQKHDMTEATNIVRRNVTAFLL